MVGSNNPRTTGASIAALLVLLCGIGLAGVLFVNGDATMERLGLLFGLLGLAAPAFVAAMRSDQASAALDGGMDDRIRQAVHAALSARRGDDPPDGLAGDPLAVHPDDPGPAGPA